MDLTQGALNQAMLTMAELASRPDFRLGEAIVSPSTRCVTGPGGKIDVEPRVMQVLVVLADAADHVVTRDTLFSRCWGGVYVGDDSLNRTIAGVRKIAENVAGGSFEVETVPRTGYRLVVKAGAFPGETDDAGVSPVATRRAVIGGALAVAAAGGGGALWVKNRREEQFDALMRRAEASLRGETELSDKQLIETLERAVALDPGNAKSWGMLANVRGAVAERAEPQVSKHLVEGAKYAAGKALAIDPKEANALTALAEIEAEIDGWARFDEKLRKILAIAPHHMRAISILGVLTQGAGLNRESWDWNERALALQPLSTLHLTRRALKLWILERTSEAHRVINRVRELWPLDEWAYYVQFQLFALTGRFGAARTMIDGNARMIGPPPAVAMWNISLEALDQRTEASIDLARKSVFDTAKLAPGLAAHGVLILAALGEVDAAFDVADGLLLSRGPIVVRAQNGARAGVNDPGWRWTPWLFTPPAAVMRADPRFLPLCDGIGLTDYWRRRGVQPDYLLARGQERA